MGRLDSTFLLDGRQVPFSPGQTILQAARAQGQYIPHLCYHPDLRPLGNCKLCTVKANGRFVSACTWPAAAGLEVENQTPELNEQRRSLLQMFFVEGNHFCPGCEKSGQCQLQALAYDLEMLSPHFRHYFPDRTVDGSHPDFLLDLNRCILCERCVCASSEVDGKHVFSIAGRGRGAHLAVNSASGKLGDTDFALDDKAAEVCPVGAILPKRVGFRVPIGQRSFDQSLISEEEGL